MPKQIDLFKNKEALIEAASEQANKNDDEALKKSIFLYYIARYFVAVYESRYGEIPIQVWNEYRNALDHYFRHITGSSSAENQDMHLHKMEGHLQRAALDVLKILSHKTQDTISTDRGKYHTNVLRLIDNGGFLTDLTRDSAEAEKLFSQAKVSDLSLGVDAKANSEILEMYLDTAFAFDAIKLKLIERSCDIEQAQIAHDGISKKAKNLSFLEEYCVHGIFYLTLFLGGMFLKDPAISAFNSAKSFFSNTPSSQASDILPPEQQSDNSPKIDDLQQKKKLGDQRTNSAPDPQ